MLETWIRFFLLLPESAVDVMFKVVTPSVIPSIAHCFPSLFSFFQKKTPLIHNNGPEAKSLFTSSYLKSVNVLLKQKAASHRLWKV